MVPDAIDERQLSSVAQALLKSVSELASDSDKRVYAVMDGSQFNDLPRLLKQADISHRPLYRYAGGDYAVIVGGPWLVDPYQAALPHSMRDRSAENAGEDDVSEEELEARSMVLSAQMVGSLNAGDPTGGGVLPEQESNPALVTERLQKIIALADAKPALVFWSGSSDFSAEILYRHLRGLNRISVPKAWKDDRVSNDGPHFENEEELTAAGDHSRSQDVISGGQEMVIFRHADANVMMQTIPALNDVQVARLFGAATQLVFAPDKAWGGGIKRARRASFSEYSGSGTLTFSKYEMNAISEFRDRVSSQRISDYLDRNASNHLLHLDGRSRDRWIASHLSEARSFGVHKEADIARWCYLQAITKGQLTKQPGVAEYMRSGGDSTPDDKVRQLFRSIIAAAKNQELSS